LERADKAVKSVKKLLVLLVSPPAPFTNCKLSLKRACEVMLNSQAKSVEANLKEREF